MVSFYAFAVIFKHPVQLTTCSVKTCSFQKGHPNQMGGCPDTLVTPLDPPLDCLYIYTVL